MSSSFPIKKGFEQGDVLSLLLNFTLEYAIRKVQETSLGVDMNGIHQILCYIDVSLIGEDTRTIERDVVVLLNDFKDSRQAVKVFNFK